MAAISTILAGIGVAAAVAGTGMQFMAQQRQAQANKQMIAAQRDAERQRQLAMNLDAQRRRREVIRQAQVAQSNAQAVATNQGAGQSTGLPGALGAISGQTGVNALGISQNQEIGNNIFAANARQSLAQEDSNSAASFGALGGGISSLGGAMVKNSGTIDKLATYYTSRSNVGPGTGMSFY